MMNNFNVYSEQELLQEQLYPSFCAKDVDNRQFKAIEMLLAGNSNLTTSKETGLFNGAIIELRKRCGLTKEEVVIAEKKLDPEQRKKEKQAARKEDAKNIAEGKITPEELDKNNSAFNFPQERLSIDMSSVFKKPKKEESLEEMSKRIGISVDRLKEYQKYTKIEDKQEQPKEVDDHQEQKMMDDGCPNFTVKEKESDSAVTYWLTRINDPGDVANMDGFGGIFSGERLREGIVKLKKQATKPLYQIQEPKRVHYQVGKNKDSGLIDRSALKGIKECTTEMLVRSKEVDKDFWRDSNTRLKKNRSYGINFDLDIWGNPIKAPIAKVGSTFEHFFYEPPDNKLSNEIVEVLEIL